MAEPRNAQERRDELAQLVTKAADGRPLSVEESERLAYYADASRRARIAMDAMPREAFRPTPEHKGPHTLESLDAHMEVFRDNLMLQMSTAHKAAGYGDPTGDLLGAWYHSINSAMGTWRIALQRLAREQAAMRAAVDGRADERMI